MTSILRRFFDWNVAYSAAASASTNDLTAHNANTQLYARSTDSGNVVELDSLGNGGVNMRTPRAVPRPKAVEFASPRSQSSLPFIPPRSPPQFVLNRDARVSAQLVAQRRERRARKHVHHYHHHHKKRLKKVLHTPSSTGGQSEVLKPWKVPSLTIKRSSSVSSTRSTDKLQSASLDGSHALESDSSGSSERKEQLVNEADRQSLERIGQVFQEQSITMTVQTADAVPCVSSSFTTSVGIYEPSASASQSSVMSSMLSSSAASTSASFSLSTKAFAVNDSLFSSSTSSPATPSSISSASSSSSALADEVDEFIIDIGDEQTAANVSHAANEVEMTSLNTGRDRQARVSGLAFSRTMQIDWVALSLERKRARQRRRERRKRRRLRQANSQLNGPALRLSTAQSIPESCFRNMTGRRLLLWLLFAALLLLSMFLFYLFIRQNALHFFGETNDRQSNSNSGQ